MLEPFYGGSHELWADGLAKHSVHNIHISGLPDRYWKWRMHGSALTFAERHKEDIDFYDLVMVTDLCDVAALKGLLPIKVPVILYFHENQLSYPWSPDDADVRLKRDRHYMWINFTSAMAADYIWFNSHFNRTEFLTGVEKYLKPFPDHNRFKTQDLNDKSDVIPLGMDLDLLINGERTTNDIPVIVWNHRWEYDKNPDLFFRIMNRLHEDEIPFKLLVLGERTSSYPEVFDLAQAQLKDVIIYFGHIESRIEYYNILLKGDIALITNDQDFFGISVVESIAAGIIPLMPSDKVYGEHINPDKYSELFYQDGEDLYIKLKNLLLSTHSYSLRDSVQQYDWKEIIKRYDLSLSILLE